MKCILINLRKKGLSQNLTKIMLMLVLTVAISFGIISKLFRDELIIYANSSVDESKIVIIDAGHGGEDSGAVGENGVLEKNLNLEIAFEIGRQLEERGYIAIYTRTDDRLLYKDDENVKGIRKLYDLKNRCQIADRYPNATFISIHMNSFGEAKYSGLQVYYSQNDEHSAVLASSIQNRVVSDVQKDNKRHTKVGEGMYLLENIDNTAVLIECGFLTNPDECRKLSDKEYPKLLSFSIVCGIIEYKESISE